MSAVMMKSSLLARPLARTPAPTTASLKLKPATVVKAAPKLSVKTSSNRMMVWREDNNKQFELFSFLPPLTKEQTAKQIDYIVGNGWVPCLEFARAENAYVSNHNCIRIQASSGFYDNRYWAMWKLPMFGCTGAEQVLAEIDCAVKALPNNYIRIAAFDSKRQVQIISFLVHRPPGGKEYRLPNDRQVA